MKKAERITIRKCGSFVAVHNVIGRSAWKGLIRGMASAL
jgi:hypothetical protein